MVKAEVRYTKNHYKQLINHSFLLIYKIISYIMLTVNCLICLLAIFGKLLGADYSLIPAFIPLVLGIYLLIHFMRLPNTMVKHHFQQFPDSVEYYSLGEDNFTDITKGSGINNEQIIPYDRFISCYENREWFLLFLTKNSAYIIHKSEITEGTPDELRELLKRKLGNKFRR